MAILQSGRVATMSHRALFLDRDGTLVHASHYPSHPEQLHLYDGIGPLLQTLQQHYGFRLIIITNQAGIARGYFTEADLQLMHDSLTDKLTALGVHVDGIYHCPHHPEGVIEGLSISCECRKPQPGMLLRAAYELNLDLEHSWFVGDILDDVEAGNRANCRTILVDLDTESPPQQPLRVPTFVARNTLHALQIIRHVEETPALNLVYRPGTWRVRQGVSGVTRG